MWPFLAFVIAHVFTGAVALVLFWVPVLARKGGRNHRKYGRWFAWSMVATGSIAVAIAVCSLTAPLATHPDFDDPALVRGLFGWMMLYLALLTVSLGWHSLQTIAHKVNHGGHRDTFSIGIQLAVVTAAFVCAAQGWMLAQPLMIGIAVIGVISGTTSLWFIFSARPPAAAYLLEHVKAGIGAGISGYTAFLSVGLVRLVPEHAFNPAIWAVPVMIGVGLIVYHQRQIRLSMRMANGPHDAALSH